MKKLLSFPVLFFFFLIPGCRSTDQAATPAISSLRDGFINLPDSVRPGVYWYFMDGNISREGMTADLESMKKAGIGNVVFLEVNVGIPRGEIDFLSEEWQNLFTHAVREAERLGIAITLGVGPGWTGSGGPWVSGQQSMKHLVASSLNVTDKDQDNVILPKPLPKKPYFGEGAFTPEVRRHWEEYYEDVCVLAFPTPSADCRIEDIEEKALYYRAPYTSKPGVRPYFPYLATHQSLQDSCVIPQDKIVDVTGHLQPDGRIDWKIPEGNWTIMRLGSRNNGAVTRPAPLPGVGFEADKFDTTAIRGHLNFFTEKLLEKIGVPGEHAQGGLRILHMDSWEMGSQNWSANFRQEFQKRRSYDPLPYYPVYSGLIVGSLERSERFLWDLRQTAQELVIENHAQYLKSYGQKLNLAFSIEPYDMNPTADLELGAVADIPMCEFWSLGYGFNSSFSCIEAVSVAHVNGSPVVAAEAFTAHKDAWKQYPGSMKNQGDWAFAAGINRLVYHTFQHQPLPDDLKPGMTMGPYGVHWDRNQTWWPMAEGYHRYISRCQYILQQGVPVADILYLVPEGSPHVFRPPASALTGSGELPDRRGYNFDGCTPSQLLRAGVQDNRIVFPGGVSYRVLVLPATETMTSALVWKIGELVKAGAVVVGNPPYKSPGLSNYPECDLEVAAKAKSLWGESLAPGTVSEISFGEGKIFWGGALSQITFPELYPSYDATSSVLRQMGAQEDFESDGPVRYTHHSLESGEIYFVSNKTSATVNPLCTFRVNEGLPELWNPLTGEVRPLPVFQKQDGRTIIPLKFEPYESFFIIFNRQPKIQNDGMAEGKNFLESEVVAQITDPWSVSFDPEWGGPKNVVFEKLTDWSTHVDEGIKYYSGIATYRNTINLPATLALDEKTDLYLKLGEVYNLARIRINGLDMGVVWTPPFEVKITDAVLAGINAIEIEVANLWPNRLIGDERFEDDGIRGNQWPDWLLRKEPRPSKRFSFSTYKFFQKDSELIKSGLIGAVQILVKSKYKK